jgi:tetratricopeptide (TPR) repeat protein
VATSGSGGPECLDDVTVVEFLEGRLSPEARAAVNAHVDRCDACLALVAAVGRELHSESRGEQDETNTSADRADRALKPGAALGRYEIVRWLGSGGMSTVYAARDPELGREIALKLLRGAAADEQTRLLREAQAMAQLSHPNVAAIHDVGRVGGQVFIALELVDGPTLGAWVREPGRSLGEILAVFVQAGQGLVAAHDAGIVHRDFKPDNVMLGPDERPRVLDFGLAAERARDGLLVPDEPSTWQTTLTVDGAFVGTPSYMSPEQYRSEVADARSDQFSFCVALHEALHGERPFVGGSFDELSAAVRRGQLTEPAGESRFSVPSRVRRAVRRGLSVDPGSRWLSMRALLEALEHAESRRRRGWIAGGVIVASAGGGAWVAFERDAKSRACADESNTLADAWALRRPSVSSALGEGGARPNSDAALERLDIYASEWAATRAEQCEDARVHQSMPTAMWERMQACFDDRRRGFEAVGRVLAEADASTSARALQLVGELDAVEACLDESGLMRQLDLPDDPELRAQVSALRDELAAMKPLSIAGQLERGQALARSVLERAEPLGYAPLTVEARFWVGAFAARADERSVDLSPLEEVAEDAGAIGHDEYAAEASMELLRAHTDRVNFEVASVWGRFARMVLARMDADVAPEMRVFLHTRLATLARARADFEGAARELELAQERAEALGRPRPLAVVLSARAEVAIERSDYERGRDLLLRARALLLKDFGDENPEVAVIGESLAIAHAQLGELDEAEALQQHAIRVHRATSGAEHPVYARALNNLGTLRLKQRRWEDSRELFAEATSISERANGDTHRETTKYRKNFVLSLTRLEKYEEALPLGRRNLAELIEELGPEHPDVAGAHTSVGLVLRRMGKNSEAREHYITALAILDAVFPEGGRRTANVLNNLGVSAMADGDVGAAERYHHRALDIRVRIFPDDHVMVAVSRLRVGEALCELKRCEEGRPLLEQGIATEAKGMPPKIRAQGLFALAQVVDDHARAETLAQEAKRTYEGLTSDVDAWLAARG